MTVRSSGAAAESDPTWRVRVATSRPVPGIGSTSRILRRLVEGSVMPSYMHLLDTPIDFKKIADRVHAAYKLGAPYDRELTESEQMAQESGGTDRCGHRLAGEPRPKTKRRHDAGFSSRCLDCLPAATGNRPQRAPRGRQPPAPPSGPCRRRATRATGVRAGRRGDHSPRLIQPTHRCREHVERRDTSD